MRSFGFAAALGVLAFALACGSSTPAAPPPAAAPAVDPATAATVTAIVTFDGEVPPPQMITITGDPKCVSENGAPQRADEKIVVGDNRALQNVFVYVKDARSFGAPVPAEPVVLDQDKCRYTPRVVGVRVGQPLEIRNSDPLLHNIRSNGVINQAFNKSTPVEGMRFTHTFATSEVMVPFKCDVHGWMSAWVGVLDHPYFGTTAPDGRVVLGNLPPGTYTVEAWHESLGSKTQLVTVGAKESKDVSFAFSR